MSETDTESIDWSLNSPIEFCSLYDDILNDFCHSPIDKKPQKERYDWEFKDEYGWIDGACLYTNIFSPYERLEISTTWKMERKHIKEILLIDGKNNTYKLDLNYCEISDRNITVRNIEIPSSCLPARSAKTILINRSHSNCPTQLTDIIAILTITICDGAIDRILKIGKLGVVRIG